MKKKITLALILLTASCLGSYFYSNRYSFFKYLPAVEENKQLRNISFMLEATVITNLAYVDLMSFENIEILEENLVFNEDEKVPFKRSHKNGVYGVNIPFENNTYLWVELKEKAMTKNPNNLLIVLWRNITK